MSKTLSTVAAKQFDTEVKQAYQGVGKIKGAVTLRTGITGDTYNFRAIGQGLAKERTAPSSDVQPMNVDHSLIPVVLKNIEAPEYTDIFDNAEVNFSEVQELAQVITAALGRKEDQYIIDALAASGTTKVVGTDIGGVGTGLNVDKLRRAAKLLNDNDVPMEDRYAVISSEGLEGLLGETEATSSDYASVKALVSGDIDTFMGFKFITIGTRTEGGLPKAGNVRDSFFFHKTSVGYAEGIAVSTNVDWIPTKQSWLSMGKFKGNAVARDALGIVKVQYTEA